MLLSAALSLVFAQAAAGAATPDWGSPRYRACTAAIEANAEQAYETAMAWANEGHDLEPLRCAALALVQLGRHELAARRLEGLAAVAEGYDAGTRAGLLVQAGHAWLLAEDAAHARSAFTLAIAEIGADRNALPDVLIDRAIAYAEESDWRNAEEDLSRALDLRGDDALALRLRAMARLRQGALDLALADAQRAVALAPRDVDAALTLGHVRETQRRGRAFDAE